MVGGLIVGLGALALALAGAVEVQLEDRNIRLHDVVDGGDADKSYNPVIARLPRGANRIELTEETARQLIKNQTPLAQPDLSFEDQIIFVAPAHSTAARSGRCFAAATAIARGEFITLAQVEPVVCDGTSTSRSVGYDRDAGAAFARDLIEAGEYLGPVRPVVTGRVAKSQNVRFVTGSNGVTIARSASTLQGGREGSNVFIQTSDGDVFAVPFSNLAEDETP